MYGVGIAIGIIIFAILAVLAVWTTRYVKVGPDEAVIVSGRRRTVTREDKSTVVGYRIVRNGGTFVVPVIEKVGRLSLEVLSSPVHSKAAMSREGVPLSVLANALFKIGNTDEMVAAAAERYMGRDATEIINQVRSVLEGHIRGVCGTMTPEAIYQDRQAFQSQIAKQAEPDLNRLGIQLDALTLSEITDETNYLMSLGKARTAEVVRDARIGQATANREAQIKEAENKQAAEVRTAETQIQIASAEKDRDVQRALFAGSVAEEQARAKFAGPRSEAEAQQNVAEQKRKLAERVAAQREQELVGEIVRPSEAQALKVRIDAEGNANAVRIAAEAEKLRLVATGSGEASNIESVGRAEATVIQAKKTAEAEGQKAMLLAEADGLLKKAEAMQRFNEAGMGLQVALELIHELPAIIKAASEPVSHIDSIRIVDFGSGGSSNGHGGAGGGPIDKVLSITPKSLGTADESLRQTLGIGLADMIQLIRTGKAEGILGMKRDVEDAGGGTTQAPKAK